MTAVSGTVARRSRDDLERECLSSLQHQDLYWRNPPKLCSVDGACFGAALYPTSPEDLNDRQPLRAGSIILVADARLDNRDELIRALGEGSVADSRSHSDLILAAWLRWQEGAFDRLIGSYAFAIYNAESARLILARSPTFDRPLCYRLTKDGLRFASMPSGVAQGTFEPDLTALAKLIVHGDLAPGETSFAGIRQVLPGHHLDWTPRGSRMARFWNPPDVDEDYRSNSAEELRHWLDVAVATRLSRPAGRIASHLSAGFDSSAVTATAARLLPDKSELIAFTGVPTPGLPWTAPRNVVADESSGARDVAERYGIEHRLVFGSAPLLSGLRGHGRYFQAPMGNVPNMNWAEEIDHEARRAGASVLLSAARGNATLSFGGIDILSEWLRRRRLIDYFRQIRALVRNGHARWRGAIFYSIDELVPPPIWSWLAGHRGKGPKDMFVHPQWMKVPDETATTEFGDRPRFRRIQYDIFVNGDVGIFTKGTLGKQGFDERDPTADIRLAEFALRLPPHHLLGDGMTRRLARTGLSDRLPKSILDHRSRGYQSADWFAKLDVEDAGNWIEEIAASSSACQLLDLAELRRCLNDWPRIANLSAAPQRTWGQRFTRAIAVGAFLRECEREPDRIGRRG